jgi:hypothetical protein
MGRGRAADRLDGAGEIKTPGVISGTYQRKSHPVSQQEIDTCSRVLIVLSIWSGRSLRV